MLGSRTLEMSWSATMAMANARTAFGEETLLIERCRRGDEDAFAELVRRHQKRVFQLARRFFPRAEDVEEAAQETFLTAWLKLDTYRAEAPFEHWLTRVCLNCCYGLVRRRKPTVELGEQEERIAAPAGDPDVRMEVTGLLRRLDPRDRFVLALLHGEQWSTAEIAERLGWSKTNVKVRAHRARARLRRLLEKG